MVGPVFYTGSVFACVRTLIAKRLPGPDIRSLRLMHEAQDHLLLELPIMTTNRFPSIQTKRIDVSDIHELRAWSSILHVTQLELLNAVRDVGDSVAKVREYFLKRLA